MTRTRLETSQCVVFILEGRLYGIRLAVVSRVVRAVEITPPCQERRAGRRRPGPDLPLSWRSPATSPPVNNTNTMDMVLCRNVLMYFCPGANRREGNTERSLTEAASIIKRIAQNMLRDLHLMREVLGESAREPDFACLAHSASSSFSRIGHQIMEGRSMPWVKVKYCPGGSPVRRSIGEVRLGVFPLAGNFFHWGRLLGGLLTMETFALDKIIFVIAGSDPRKPELAPAEARHVMARSLLGLFRPLFEYSSVAMGDSSAGEENLFRILGMNPRQHIHAFYIAGSDHYHRYDPGTGNPDTVQKLEEGIARAGKGFDNHINRVSAVFLGREPIGEQLSTSLDVPWVWRIA